MKRTQIYFNIDLYRTLQSEARRHQVTVSEMIRRVITEHLAKEPKKKRYPLLELADLATQKKGPKNLSRDYKKILYGTKRR